MALTKKISVCKDTRNGTWYIYREMNGGSKVVLLGEDEKMFTISGKEFRTFFNKEDR